MLFIILSILALIYLFSIPALRKKKFGAAVARLLRIIIFTATPILIAILIAESYNIYPKQYWTTKVLFWLVVFSCMAAFGLCKKEDFGKYERVIYKTIFFLPLVLLLFLFVPFIGIGVGLLFYVKFIGDEKFILFNDDNIRIEQPYIRFIGPDPQPVLYVKKQLIAYRDTILPIHFNESKDKMEVTKHGNSVYVITFRVPDNWEVPEGMQTFRYTVSGH